MNEFSDLGTLTADGGGEEETKNEQQRNNDDENKIGESFETEKMSQGINRLWEDSNDDKYQWEKKPGDRYFYGHGVFAKTHNNENKKNESGNRNFNLNVNHDGVSFLD